MNKNSKNKILTRIRQSEEQNRKIFSEIYDLNFSAVDYFADSGDDTTLVFAENFIANGGKFIFCDDLNELISNLNSLLNSLNQKTVCCFNNQIKQLLKGINIIDEKSFDSKNFYAVTVTECKALVARTGSIVCSSEFNFGRTSSLVSDIHIIIASSNQIVNDIENYLSVEFDKKYNEFPSFVSFVSSNSKTADIEKTLVNGAHGPIDVYLFLLP